MPINFGLLNFKTVFVGLGISIALIALIINAAACYSCHNNRSADIEQFRNSVLGKRKFTLVGNIGSLRFSELKDTLTDLPAKLKNYVYSKTMGRNEAHKNNNSYYEESSSYGPNYNGFGSVSHASSFCRSEGGVYNSGVESEYNASILSDSCSISIPTPPPPPPAPPQVPPPVPEKTYLTRKSLPKKIMPKDNEDYLSDSDESDVQKK
ncbi:hypothetical protein BpHYR1_010736 [Brachionus plicatilis]|uniref:Uncharacterized protein n=1 Tax=Brachionus plicatilis TaxID=10195 RepID=A0A3M7SZ93_BRAPC|nr:hypothetical protein BpHYR1_010736 [Brachionus plicatilis]